MSSSRIRSASTGLVARRVLVTIACLQNLSGFQGHTQGATLAELFNGGFIDVGNSRFDNWELLALDSTAAANPDLTQIAVVPLANDTSNPGLQFAANGQLSISGVNSIDLMFKFRVHALSSGKAFTNHSLALTGINFGSNEGLAFISDELQSTSGAGLEPTLVIVDMESNFTQSFDVSDFAPQSAVFVVTNIFISGLSATNAINLTSFTQRFSQTGPAVLLGDYNGNGVVDAADYVVWRKTLGQMGSGLAADGNNNGQIDSSDYNIWRAQFGQSFGSGSGVNANAAVPEPTTLILIVLAAAGWSLRRR